MHRRVGGPLQQIEEVGVVRHRQLMLIMPALSDIVPPPFSDIDASALPEICGPEIVTPDGESLMLLGPQVNVIDSVAVNEIDVFAVTSNACPVVVLLPPAVTSSCDCRWRS